MVLPSSYRVMELNACGILASSNVPKSTTLLPDDKQTLTPQKGIRYKEYGVEHMWNLCVLYLPHNMQQPK